MFISAVPFAQTYQVTILDIISGSQNDFQYRLYKQQFVQPDENINMHNARVILNCDIHDYLSDNNMNGLYTCQDEEFCQRISELMEDQPKPAGEFQSDEIYSDDYWT